MIKKLLIVLAARVRGSPEADITAASMCHGTDCLAHLIQAAGRSEAFKVPERACIGDLYSGTVAAATEAYLQSVKATSPRIVAATEAYLQRVKATPPRSSDAASGWSTPFLLQSPASHHHRQRSAPQCASQTAHTSPQTRLRLQSLPCPACLMHTSVNPAASHRQLVTP